MKTPKAFVRAIVFVWAAAVVCDFVSVPVFGASQQPSNSPLRTLPPEYDVILRTEAVPDPASPDYLVATQAQNATPEMFNGSHQTTWNAEITGKTVIFDKADEGHGNLYTRFNNRRDLKSLIVYAETVIIRSPLVLPGTNVTVYARDLRFEDHPERPSASLNTTPLPYLIAASAVFENGAEGQKGGDILLRIGALSAQGSGVRLISGGGRGQNPGPGRPGNAKPAMPTYGNLRAAGNRVGNALDFPFRKQGWGWVLGVSAPFPGVVWITHSATHCQFRVDGSQRWPQDGEPGLPAGIPGTGGRGGTITVSQVIGTGLANAPGGPSGDPAPPQAGGPPQEPRRAIWVKSIDGSRCTDDYFNFMVIAEHTSSEGPPAPVVGPLKPRGTDGSVTSAPSTAPLWLHPHLLRMVIAHAKDAYRLGNLSYTQAVFDEYSRLIDEPNFSLSAFAEEFDEAGIEMQMHLLRIASNLDYFGNAAGWAPLLSLESTMSAFTDEVDAAIPVIFLSRWLQTRANQNQKDLVALQDGISRVEADALAAAEEVDGASQAVPSLEADAARVAYKLDEVEKAVAERKAQLLREAERRVADSKKTNGWFKALNVIGAVAQMVPVYQPALGIIGQGMTFISQIDASKPLQSFDGAPDLTPLLKGKTWSDSRADYKALVESINLKTEAQRKALRHRLRDSFDKTDLGLIKQTVERLKATQVSAEDVQREFDLIKNQDSLFNDLIQQVTDLHTEKQVLAQSLAATLASIASGTSTIARDIAALSSMTQNLDATASQFDHALLIHVREMEHRARERLLRYQYCMAKAYEYRMLKPYTGNLNVDSVVNRILGVIGTINTTGYPAHATDIEVIKSVYKESVRQIVDTALTELQKQPPERSLPFFFNLTPSELQELNATGQLTLDLGSRIAGLPNEENRHIADLRIADMAVESDRAMDPSGRVRVLISQRGQATATRDGRRYRFYFGNGADVEPFTWGALCTLPSGRLSHESYSLAGLSLLRSLLKMPGSPNAQVDPLVLFARPPADAVVTVTKVNSPGYSSAPITRMQIEVTVDFFRNMSKHTTLTVKQAPDRSSYIAVSQQDVNGRQDGRGTFARRFVQGQTVMVTAEPTLGDAKFRRWVDGTGKELTTSATFSLNMSSSRQIEPKYSLDLNTPTAPSPAGPPAPTKPASLVVSPAALQFGAVKHVGTLTAVTGAQTVSVLFANGSVSWTASTDQPWLRILNGSGSGSGQFNAAIVESSTFPEAGTLTASINLSAPGATAPSYTIPVTLVIHRDTASSPIGVIETPKQGVTGLTGAVPFTGWALDDVDVTGLTVCRAPIAGEPAPKDPRCGGSAQVFVGDATFVEGSRPDVQAGYPYYPRNGRAGWGLMVLTNMLPNLGNGSFTFSFYASDPDGHTVLLGTRAVTCDNAHATRPFGAIDTPAPGEVVNGTTYDNFGWVLAPAPGLAAPPDGGTVTVFIDGVPHGSPRAWGPRDDLSKLFAVKTFPGIARAQGVFTLDLSGLSNGVHTIAWTVTDHLGASAGIGSRYFTVVNGAAVGSTTSSQKSETRGTSVRASWSEPAAPIVSVAVNRAALDTGVIRVRRGYIEDTPFRNVRPGPGDRTIIQAEELDRIEMRFGGTDGDYTGYVRVGHDLVALPIGSQLDRSAGTFTWQPGAGFVGAYDLVFVRWNDSGPVARREVRIVLNPHGSGRVGPQVVVDTPTGHMSPDESIPQPLVVAGWAVDLDASLGTGIDAVHVWAYPLTGGNPVFVGDATYGGRRPDVGAVHGDHFRDSGYGLTVRDLAPGVYDLAVFARSAGTGRFAPAKIVRVSVQ